MTNPFRRTPPTIVVSEGAPAPTPPPRTDLRTRAQREADQAVVDAYWFPGGGACVVSAAEQAEVVTCTSTRNGPGCGHPVEDHVGDPANPCSCCNWTAGSES